MSTDQYYNKNMLDEHFSNVDKRFDAQDTMLIDLNRKVGIQNGRTSKLETKWASVVIGGLVATALVGTIIALVVYSFQLSQENLKNTILLELKK